MKKNHLQWGLPVVLMTFCVHTMAQNVGIGTSTPHPSAQLDISSTARGLLIPRMNAAGILAIPAPAKGLLVYDSVGNQFMVNMGSPTAPDWENITGNSNSGSGWGLKGNNAATDSSFIGTTNAVPLHFRVDNLRAGELDSTRQNTFLGALAGPAATSAQTIQNTALGFNALGNTTGGSGNTAIGDDAMAANIAGIQNVAVGQFALQSMQNGVANIAIGATAMSQATAGTFNTAIGSGSLAQNTGNSNVSVGGALTGNSGDNNVAIGVASLDQNSGNGNVSIGISALNRTNASSFNTVVGYNSGSLTNMGFNNVLLGANNDVTPGVNGLFNVILIGQDVHASASNSVRIGNLATKTIGGFQDWTNFSDGRYKKNMKENVKGIDFIMRLRPITYNLDVNAIQSKMTGSKSVTMHPSMAKSMQETEQMVLSGFSAQEVEQAAQASGYPFSGVDKPQTADGFYGLRYGDFVVPLVKAVQEQQRLIEALEKRITTLERQLPTKN